MKRKPQWGQDNPGIQLKVILGVIKMEALGWEEGISSVKAPSRVLSMVEDARELTDAIIAGDNAWDPV